MIPLENLAAFAVASAVLILIPGPSVLFVIGRALSLGRTGALLSVLGNALGAFVLVVAIAAGLGVLIEQSVVLFMIVKYVGAAYLVYLGIQAIRHRHREPATDATARRAGTVRVLREGFFVGVTNPKLVVFFLAVLPQFVAPAAGSVPAQMLVFGAIFLVLALILDSTWALAAGSARDWFARSPKRLPALSATGGVAMIGLGGALVFTESKT